MSSDTPNALLSPSDVAELAGVGRSVVSNWRRRDVGFPGQVDGTDANPLFSRVEVVSWLKERGHQVEGDGPGPRLWSAVNALRSTAPPDDIVEYVLYLAVAKRALKDEFRSLQVHPADQAAKLEGALGVIKQQSGLESLVAPPAGVTGAQPSASLAVAEIAGIDTADLAEAVDYVLERVARLQVKRGADYGFVGSPTSKLLALLVGDVEGIVLDPACGIADTLLRIADENQAARLVGSDVNVTALRVAAQRAYLRGLHVELAPPADVLQSDPFPRLQAEVVVIEPPFGMSWDPSSKLLDERFAHGVPPKSSSDLAWIQHALAHLSETGRAYVLTSPQCLFSRGPEAQIRASLVNDGLIEAIVLLPPKLLPHTSIGLALWVIRGSETHELPLLIDASDVEGIGIEDRVADWLHGKMEDVPHARIGQGDLLLEDSVLLPSRWIGAEPPDTTGLVSHFGAALDEVESAVDFMSHLEIAFPQLAQTASVRMTSVRDLIRSGVVELSPGRVSRGVESDAGLAGTVVRPSDLVKDWLSSAANRTGDPSGEGVTEQQDVLVATTNGIWAVVDRLGGHHCSVGVDRLRVLDRNMLHPEYLSAFLAGPWNNRFMVGTSAKRARIRDLEIPLIPFERQTAVVEVLERLRLFEAAAHEVASGAVSARAALVEAVRFEISLEDVEFVGVAMKDAHDKKGRN